MTRVLLALTAALLVAGLGGCKTNDTDGDGYPDPYTAPPAGSQLAKVTPGMMETDVRRILGDPDGSNAYQTGKAWIPYYYGTDVSRSDWMYTGKGRVVFSRNRYTGGLKVIRVMYNPNEP